MKHKTYAVALLLFCSIGITWAQSPIMKRPRSLPPSERFQGLPLAVLPPMSDFERFSGDHYGHPLVELTLPTIPIDAGDTSLKLTPRSLALFDQPSGPKAFAVLLEFYRSTPPSPGADVQHSRSQAPLLSTYLDDDELSEFVSLLRKLATTGVPPPPTLGRTPR